MKNRRIYIEGGGDSEETLSRCREAFSRLFEKAGFDRRMPRMIPCGGRESAFDSFRTAHNGSRRGDFIAMLIDSEDPVSNIERTWAHLKQRDDWNKPTAAIDEQVLFMTTCMETWIVVDRQTLREHYGHKLQESALPPVEGLEFRSRQYVHNRLAHATRRCSNRYAKGKRSFEVLQKLDPAVLQTLPSFVRVIRILNGHL